MPEITNPAPGAPGLSRGTWDTHFYWWIKVRHSPQGLNTNSYRQKQGVLPPNFHIPPLMVADPDTGTSVGVPVLSNTRRLPLNMPETVG